MALNSSNYTVSIDQDWRLYKQDIAGSIAHARMLGRQGIIGGDEATLVQVAEDFVDRQVRKLSNSHVVHDGLAFGDPARPVPIREVPGVLEAGWKSISSHLSWPTSPI